MKLASIFFAGTAKATAGVVVTLTTAATVVTAASIAYSPAPPVEEADPAVSAYVDRLPKEISENSLQITIDGTDRDEGRTATGVRQADETPSQSGKKSEPKTNIPAPEAASSESIQAAPALPAAEAEPVVGASADRLSGETSENTGRAAAEAVSGTQNQVKADAVVGQTNEVPSQSDKKSEAKTNTPAPNTAASVPAQAASAPVAELKQEAVSKEPETAPGYQFSYDRTTSIYADDNETLIRVEYYDKDNNLTHYSDVIDYDAKTHSYTENIYTYDDETQTETLQRTDVYTGNEADNAK